MKNYFLWLGGVFSEDTLLKNPAVSTAANRWQKGLIEAVNEQGFPVLMLSHLPERIWPKGSLRPGAAGDFWPGLESHLVEYWNLPFMREYSLRRNYLKEGRGIFKRAGKPLAVFSYNPEPWAVAFGIYAQEHFQVPWIDVCADCYDPGPDWAGYATGAGLAKGHVLLSHYACQSCPFPVKINLDGGVRDIKTDCRSFETDKKIILYTGMMSIWGGVSLLLKAFSKITDKDTELWVCGPGSNPDLDAALKRDPRIKFFGLVPEAQLQQIYKQASVLVNPRPNNVNGNTMNFPSKVLEYLSYGKPVVSTWTPGLAPEYREVLEVIEEENEDCLAGTIEDVLNWTDEKKERHLTGTKDFLLKHKIWKHQAARLITWLNNDVL